MISIKQLEEAKKMLSEIKWLDNKIIQLEKLAIKISQKEGEFQISLKHKIKKEKTHEEQEKQEYSGFTFFSFGSSVLKKEEEFETIEFNLNEETSYRVLGVYMKSLVQRRQSLIIQLEKYNVKL